MIRGLIPITGFAVPQAPTSLDLPRRAPNQNIENNPMQSSMVVIGIDA
jgi:hypothetical protein